MTKIIIIKTSSKTISNNNEMINRIIIIINRKEPFKTRKIPNQRYPENIITLATVNNTNTK